MLVTHGRSSGQSTCGSVPRGAALTAHDCQPLAASASSQSQTPQGCFMFLLPPCFLETNFWRQRYTES